MEILIVKLGATGDVVRTTTLLRLYNAARITWLTERKNLPLLRGIAPELRTLSWEERAACCDRVYDLVINLEDTIQVASFLEKVECRRRWGARHAVDGSLSYSEDARGWFDLSIISQYGKEQADALKFANRSSYQQLIFRGLGAEFAGERYLLPETEGSDLSGDVALATEAGPVWPMKKWAFYGELKSELEAQGLVVNMLPTRPCIVQHLADVRGHRCLVSGDSLPMHFALGSGIKCVSLFTCTSPWEIYGYGSQAKLVSPLLDKYFYKRGFELEATTAIGVSDAFDAVMVHLNSGVRVG